MCNAKTTTVSKRDGGAAARTQPDYDSLVLNLPNSDCMNIHRVLFESRRANSFVHIRLPAARHQELHVQGCQCHCIGCNERNRISRLCFHEYRPSENTSFKIRFSISILKNTSFKIRLSISILGINGLGCHLYVL